MKLIPLDVTLLTFIVRKTIRWVDEDGKKRIKRNQVMMCINFLGVYNNVFIPNSIYTSSDGIQYYAINSNAITVVENYFTKFTLPKEIELISTSHKEL